MFRFTLSFVFLAITTIVGPPSVRAQSPQADPSQLPRIPPTAPAEALGSFEIRPGYRLELAASEPQVMDPIAFAWDARNRLFVVEMRGYSERREAALGRLRLLEDRDGDGFYETSRVYIDGLKWPTGVLCYRGGVFVIATPDLLYFKDTDDDGRADHREVIFTGFGEGQKRLNVQALANGLSWGLDGRVHGATAMNGAQLRRPGEDVSQGLTLRGQDFSFDPESFELRAEAGGGQYGLTFDDWGNKFVCSNSHHMQWIAYDNDQRLPNLPSPLVDIPNDGAAAEVFRLSPDEPWRLVRTRWRVAGQVPGPVEGGGRVSGYFTAATGICSYGGDLFTADAGSNLVHRKVLDWAGRVQPEARRPDDASKREFLASRDNWFRPVFLNHGPDGALYIADMYREVIEHPWSLPEGIKKHLDLNEGYDRGRIYRVIPEDQPAAEPVNLASLSTPKLIEQLESPIAWRRLTASRILRERGNGEEADALRTLLFKSEQRETRLLALHQLARQKKNRVEVLQQAIRDHEPWIRAAAVRLAQRAGSRNPLQNHLVDLVQDPSPKVRFQALLGAAEATRDQLVAWSSVRQEDPWCLAALRGALGKSAPALVQDMVEADETISRELLELAGRSQPSALVYRQLAEPEQNVYLIAAAQGGHRLDGILEDQAQRQALVRAHAATATDKGRPRSERLPSIALLGGLHTKEAVEALSSLLRETEDDAVAQAALAILGRRESFDHEAALLQHWPQWSPSLQSAIIDLCLTRDKSMMALLDHIESGAIRRSSLSGGQVINLQNDGNSAIRQRARALFVPRTKAEREAAVIRARPALNLAGNAADGRAHYQLRCASCHEVNLENGNTLGPNRKALAQNGKERLLINLIDPNREVLPNYFASVVTRKDGSAVTGVIIAESSRSVVVRQPLGIDAEIDREEITSVMTEQHSVMPEGLEAGLSHQELADLLAYLVNSTD